MTKEERHELALATYKAMQKRKWIKKQREKDEERKKHNDAAETGWNGYMKYYRDKLKKYY